MFLLKPFQKLIDSYDPARESIIYALKATIPALFAVAILLYSRKSFTTFFLLLPSLCMGLTFYYPTYRGKVAILLVTIFLTMAGVFTVNILIKHIYTMFLVLFPLLFLIYGTMKYKYAASIAPTFTAVALALPTGWYQGTYRCIELLAVLGLDLILLVVYEYLFTKYRARSNLVYVSQLINDLFSLFTSDDATTALRQIKHKHLFKKLSLYRTDIIHNKIFKNDTDRYFYKVNAVLIKTLPIVFDENYIFARNKFYIYGIREVFSLYRRMYRNISFMSSFPYNKKLISSHVPLTDELIHNIKARLQNQNKAIYLRLEPDLSVRNQKLIDDWKANVSSFRANIPPEVNKNETEYLLGLQYILEDMDSIRTKLKKIRYGA